MKMYYFKNGRNYGPEFCVTAKSKEDAFADLQNYLMEFDRDYPDLDYWREHPELVLELGIGQVVETMVGS